MCLVSWYASMNTSLEIWSGARFFSLFRFLMALFISFAGIGSSPSCSSVSFVSLPGNNVIINVCTRL